MHLDNIPVTLTEHPPEPLLLFLRVCCRYLSTRSVDREPRCGSKRDIGSDENRARERSPRSRTRALRTKGRQTRAIFQPLAPRDERSAYRGVPLWPPSPRSLEPARILTRWTSRLRSSRKRTVDRGGAGASGSAGLRRVLGRGVAPCGDLSLARDRRPPGDRRGGNPSRSDCCSRREPLAFGQSEARAGSPARDRVETPFAFHDGEEIGPRMLARIAKPTGLSRAIFDPWTNSSGLPPHRGGCSSSAPYGTVRTAGRRRSGPSPDWSGVSRRRTERVRGTCCSSRQTAGRDTRRRPTFDKGATVLPRMGLVDQGGGGHEHPLTRGTRSRPPAAERVA